MQNEKEEENDKTGRERKKKGKEGKTESGKQNIIERT